MNKIKNASQTRRMPSGPALLVVYNCDASSRVLLNEAIRGIEGCAISALIDLENEATAAGFDFIITSMERTELAWSAVRREVARGRAPELVILGTADGGAAWAAAFGADFEIDAALYTSTEELTARLTRICESASSLSNVPMSQRSALGSKY